MPRPPEDFALLDPEDNRWETARVAVLPVPYERTTSWGGGTAGGPEAILVASRYLEVWDEELGGEPHRQGIATLPLLTPEAFDPGAALAEVEAEARRQMEAGKFLITLGGEHALTLAPVRAAAAVYGEIGIVQLDAHADLRAEYEGTRYSHASVMHRIVVDEGIASLAVGIRSLSPPEAELVRRRDLAVVWGHQLADLGPDRFAELLAALPDRVYLTFDLDFFDPAVLPATGTPEPGGGAWYPTLALLRRLFAEKTVVAMDVVELAPIPGQPASDFLAAKLIYKCCGYLAEAEEIG